MKCLVSCLLFVSLAVTLNAQQLSPEIAPIPDDKRCEGVLSKITNDDTALSTGCARFWPKWPKADDPNREKINARILRLQAIWQSAQVQSRGHYAAAAITPLGLPQHDAPFERLPTR